MKRAIVKLTLAPEPRMVYNFRDKTHLSAGADCRTRHIGPSFAGTIAVFPDRPPGDDAFVLEHFNPKVPEMDAGIRGYKRQNAAEAYRGRVWRTSQLTGRSYAVPGRSVRRAAFSY